MGRKNMVLSSRSLHGRVLVLWLKYLSLVVSQTIYKQQRGKRKLFIPEADSESCSLSTSSLLPTPCTTPGPCDAHGCAGCGIWAQARFYLSTGE